MRIETANPYGATSLEAIAEFEARWSVVLPAEYKALSTGNVMASRLSGTMQKSNR